MPVEQGLPWHPVATGLAGQAIPFVVAASHAHALPSAPFWFPVPAVLVASPALLCPSSLSAVLALVPPGVAPAFCVSVLPLPLSVGAPGCPCRAPPRPPVRGFHISVRHGLSRAWLAGHSPVATPVAGTSQRTGRSSRPCGVRGHRVEGEGGGGVADGSLGVRRIWWLLQCSHLMVPLCIVACPVGARHTAVCGAALCPVALLLACYNLWLEACFPAGSFTSGRYPSPVGSPVGCSPPSGNGLRSFCILIHFNFRVCFCCVVFHSSLRASTISLSSCQ